MSEILWNEENEEVDVLCLFCNSTVNSLDSLVDHMKLEHGFFLPNIKNEHSLNEYQCIKLINYLRENHSKNSQENKQRWELNNEVLKSIENDKYLKPYSESDAIILTYALEIGSGNEDEDTLIPSTQTNNQNPNSKKGTLEIDDDDDLPQLETAPEQTESIQVVHEQNKNQSSSTTTKPATTSTTTVATTVATTTTDIDARNPSKQKKQRNKKPVISNDAYYFDSYAHIGIHYEMLSDRPRTESYRDCIEVLNKDLFKDKVVLDIGCGTGILSLFAARAGAKLVIGIDSSDIIEKAKQIITRNGYQDKIVLIRGKVEEVEIPVEKVDVIISEWMGYFLLFESMLDTVLFARDKWLYNPEQRDLQKHVFPNRANMLIAASSFSRLEYWNDVYGFDYTPIIEGVTYREAMVEIADPKDTISNIFTFKKIDIETAKVDDLSFTESFEIEINSEKTTFFRAFVTYFDCFFDCFVEDKKPSVILTTSPHTIPTHWKQVLFTIDKPVLVEKGFIIQGTLTCTKFPENPRELDVCIDYKVFNSNKKLITKGIQMFEV